MVDQIRALLTRHLPGYQVRTVARLGEGWDNVVYEVNGELIIRGRKETDPARRGEQTQREADLLAVVKELSTVPVPELIFVDMEAGVHAYRRLPGLPLNEHPVADPTRLAAPLGEFVSHLHRASLERMARLVPMDTDPLGAWLREAERDYREVVEWVPARDRGLVEDFLGRPPPAEPHAVAFCHNDLGSEHVLVDIETDTVTGVIDWTDAAIADPVRDLALIYRDLGPDTYDLTLTHYESHRADVDRGRVAFYARCSLLADIAYGIRTGARRYTDAGLAHLTRTFT